MNGYYEPFIPTGRYRLERKLNKLNGAAPPNPVKLAVKKQR